MAGSFFSNSVYLTFEEGHFREKFFVKLDIFGQKFAHDYSRFKFQI